MWGGSTPNRDQAVISDVYIHNNKFSTIGIWGFESHDSLYGGYGVVPAKNILWYDNEIGIFQGGFYSSGLSGMNCFKSMHDLLNGDFEYAGVGFWTTRGDAGVKSENENTYGFIQGNDKESSEIFEGLWLNEGIEYVISADAFTSGVDCTMFV